MKRYENHSAEDRADNSLFDNDIHYLNGELNEENIAKAIKWILSANLQKKPKRKLVLYVNTVGGDLYESFYYLARPQTLHPKTQEVTQQCFQLPEFSKFSFPEAKIRLRRPNLAPRRPNLAPRRPNLAPRRPNLASRRPNLASRRPNLASGKLNFENSVN